MTCMWLVQGVVVRGEAGLRSCTLLIAAEHHVLWRQRYVCCACMCTWDARCTQWCGTLHRTVMHTLVSEWHQAVAVARQCIGTRWMLLACSGQPQVALKHLRVLCVCCAWLLAVICHLSRSITSRHSGHAVMRLCTVFVGPCADVEAFNAKFACC